jgi:hypothetical protein
MERMSEEDIARERQAAIGPIREYSEEEKAEIWARQARERKEKEAERLAKSKPAAPVCLRAADPNDLECQLTKTTNSIDDTCCQAEKLTDVANVTKPASKPQEDSQKVVTNVTVSRKPTWRKARKEKEPPEPLPDRVDYIPIYNHHHGNLRYSWSEVVILSEIDFMMQRADAACHCSAQHFSSAARIGVGAARNILTKLENKGIILTMGYHDNGRNKDRTKDRIVKPEYSRYPAVSKRILAKSNGVPFYS